MTTDAIRPPEKQYRYPNALSGLVSLIKEEGLKGLARGLGPNTVTGLRLLQLPPMLNTIFRRGQF
jgi:hypothetical protein